MAKSKIQCRLFLGDLDVNLLMKRLEFKKNFNSYFERIKFVICNQKHKKYEQKSEKIKIVFQLLPFCTYFLFIIWPIRLFPGLKVHKICFLAEGYCWIGHWKNVERKVGVSDFEPGEYVKAIEKVSNLVEEECTLWCHVIGCQNQTGKYFDDITIFRKIIREDFSFFRKNKYLLNLFER